MFRNLRIYRISRLAPATAESLSEQLDPGRLRPCGRLEPSSAGWISPYGPERHELVHSVGGCHLLRYGLEEKVMPPAVVRAALAERIAEARQRTGRPPGRRDKLRFKDEVLMDLLPRAFVKPRAIDAYLDLDAGWLVVDAGTVRQADEVATALRMNLTGLELVAPDLRNRICTHLSQWLRTGRCPGEFELGDECDLRSERDATATIRCRRQDLTAPEIRQHLGTGMQVFRLGLRWGERLNFAVTEEFVVTKLKPGAYLAAQLADLASDSDVSRIEAEFALGSLEYRTLIDQLARVFEWEEG